MFTGTAIGRAAQRVGLPVTWGVSFFCLFTTWALAATLHNTTAILVATPITIIICQQFDVSARPILYASLVASNLGGFSTRWGDTPNLIEAAQWGLQYGDFVQIMAINRPAADHHWVGGVEAHSGATERAETGVDPLQIRQGSQCPSHQLEARIFGLGRADDDHRAACNQS